MKIDFHCFVLWHVILSCVRFPCIWRDLETYCPSVKTVTMWTGKGRQCVWNMPHSGQRSGADLSGAALSSFFLIPPSNKLS